MNRELILTKAPDDAHWATMSKGDKQSAVVDLAIAALTFQAPIPSKLDLRPEARVHWFLLKRRKTTMQVIQAYTPITTKSIWDDAHAICSTNSRVRATTRPEPSLSTCSKASSLVATVARCRHFKPPNKTVADTVTTCPSATEGARWCIGPAPHASG